ncbi:hypothetical protein DNTS_029871 [Danionella cerebrum]|uniref:Small monomeric GTPase n=1 Tax=Danionella cerebrum TaxID=2873325 RepID=A0A553RLM3_9TELE|nr:hypothetical protein DNTS_029871 [Danionella translucida]
MDSCQYRFKIIMIGYNFVGKSSLLYRCEKQSFPTILNATIGADVKDLVLEMEPKVKVKVKVWDTAGHDRFWRLIQDMVPMSSGCLLVFDLSNRISFNYIKSRYSDVRRQAHPYSLLFLLVGHKCDSEKREVSQEEIQEFARDVDIPYIEVSARTGHNAEEAFKLLARRIYYGYIKGELHVHENWGKIKEK